MTIKSEIYTRLTTHAGLSALVSDRVYPGVRPQGSGLPAISYRTAGKAKHSAMGKDAPIVKQRFQFDVWDDDPDGRDAVVKELESALDRWSTTSGTIVQDTFFENAVDLDDPDPEIFHTAVDLFIWYEE